MLTTGFWLISGIQSFFQSTINWGVVYLKSHCLISSAFGQLSTSIYNISICGLPNLQGHVIHDNTRCIFVNLLEELNKSYMITNKHLMKGHFYYSRTHCSPPLLIYNNLNRLTLRISLQKMKSVKFCVIRCGFLSWTNLKVCFEWNENEMKRLKLISDASVWIVHLI